MDFDTAVVTWLAVAAVKLVSGAMKALIRMWKRVTMPESAQAVMSSTDEEKIEATQALLAECFGDNLTAYMADLNNLERINCVADFARKLAEVYELDIAVDVTVANAESWGGYYWKDKKAVFNIAVLTMDSSGENAELFEDCARGVIYTVVHELRHAVQHASVENEGFWNVDQEARTVWANNMQHYIRPETDLRAYAAQPIEKDASTFAALVMKGVQ